MTQCVTIWKRLKKQAHVTQVGGIETLAEFNGQGLGQFGQQALTISGTRRAALFELDDMPPHFPASVYLDHIDGAQRALTRFTYQFAQAAQQRCQLQVSGDF